MCINSIGKGNKSISPLISTRDEFGEMAQAINNAATTMIYEELLIKKRSLSKDEYGKILKVYHDVIFIITKGKFELLTVEEAAIESGQGNLETVIVINAPEDVGKAREALGEFLQSFDWANVRRMRTILCLSEAATNVLKHAEKGAVQIRQSDNAIRLVISDQGPGIDLEKLPNLIFLKGSSTKASLGCGFNIMYKYVSRIFLSTSEKGTTLILEFDRNEKINHAGQGLSL